MHAMINGMLLPVTREEPGRGYDGEVLYRYMTEDKAKSLAATLNEPGEDWTYNAVEMEMGWAIEVYDETGKTLGLL